MLVPLRWHVVTALSCCAHHNVAGMRVVRSSGASLHTFWPPAGCWVMSRVHSWNRCCPMYSHQIACCWCMQTALLPNFAHRCCQRCFGALVVQVAIAGVVRVSRCTLTTLLVVACQL